MQVILHCGAHATEEDLLLKSLLKNTGALARQGTQVPGPGRYRTLLRECVEALATGRPARDASDVLWDAILEGGQARRAVLSNPHFFGSQRHGLAGSQLYPEAETRLQALQALFPGDHLEVFLALRNPACFLPALLAKAAPATRRDLLAGCDLAALRWSELLTRMRAAAPGIQLTVWCFEDMPLLWGTVLRRMAGLAPEARLRGGLDLLAALIPGAAMQRLRAFLDAHPEMQEPHKQRVFAVFLEKYALEEAVEVELDLPGGSDALVDQLTALYEADLQAIRSLPGVTLIEPSAGV
ncbi:hypothetical protein [Cribrihabitans pelagius]|uniref:hypothetical protein n=1 Tax=Cribrihabitans pelagius TaxID=1765746 RepID=UPI003B5B9346